jgi:hypothetical protein
MAEAGRAAADTVEMMRFGAREGLLPWTRSNMTAAHMRDALRYLDSEQPEKALWEVEMALSLDPRFVEARRLKERLTGQRQYWPNGSVLDEMVDVMVEQQLGVQPDYRERPLAPNPRPAAPMPLDNPMPRAVGEAEQTEPASADQASTDDGQTAEPAGAQADSSEAQPEQLTESQADSTEPTQPEAEVALPKTLSEIDAEIQAQRHSESQMSSEETQAEQAVEASSEDLADAQWGQADPLPQAEDQADGWDEQSQAFEAEASTAAEPEDNTEPFADESLQAEADEDQQWSDWDQSDPSEQVDQVVEVETEPTAEARSADGRLFQGVDEQADEPTVSDGALPRVLIEALREMEQNQSGAPADATADAPTDEVN